MAKITEKLSISCIEESDGSFYCGELHMDIKNGLGTLFMNSGEVYIGEFKDGTTTGFGMLFDENTLFHGTFLSGLKTAEGYMCFNNGDVKKKELDEDGTQFRLTPAHGVSSSSNIRALSLLLNASLKLFPKLLALENPTITRCFSTLRKSADKLSDTSQHHIPRYTQDSFNVPLNGTVNRFLLGNANSTFDAIEPTNLMSSQKTITNKRLGDPHFSHQTDDPGLLFAVCGSMTTESFSVKNVCKQFALFLVPCLALPMFCCSPFSKFALEQERELVVSGAALRRLSSYPKATLMVLFVAFVFLILTVILGAVSRTRLPQNRKMGDDTDLIEILFPVLMWIGTTALLTGYTSCRRVAHPSERLNRELTRHLAAYSASVIDSYSPVCAYTWSEDGRQRVVNPHYRYRWRMIAISISFIVALTSPIARTILRPLYPANNNQLSSHNRIALFNILLEAASAITVFLYSSVACFYVAKITDMERQVLGELRVLSSLACVQGAGVVRPTTVRNIRYDFDQKLNFSDFFSGFTGWFYMRSFLLYNNNCSNHLSRSFAVCIIVISVFAVSAFCIVYFLLDEIVFVNLCNIDPRITCVICLFFLFFYGGLMTRCLYIYSAVSAEIKSQHYLIDLALAVQYGKYQMDNEMQRSLELLRCLRDQVLVHDPVPTPVFGLQVTTRMLMLWVISWILSMLAVGILVVYPPCDQ